jgi:hypothetical protein
MQGHRGPKGAVDSQFVVGCFIIKTIHIRDCHVVVDVSQRCKQKETLCFFVFASPQGVAISYTCVVYFINILLILQEY